MSLADRTPPTAEEFADYPNRFTNWGRWGADDQLGTLNHITVESRLRIMAKVGGRTISTGRPIDTHSGPRNPYPAMYTRPLNGAGGVGEYLGLYIHGHRQTHIDSLSHNRAMDGQHYYNGAPLGADAPPRLHGSIHHWRQGIVTRGVLYDIPRLRGTEYVEPGEPVHGWELEDAAAAQGITPEPGDAVLIRSGLDEYLLANPDGYEPFQDGHGALIPAGVHASCVEFFWHYSAGLLHWDMLDAPIRDQGLPNPIPGLHTPVHVHYPTIGHLGMPIVDNGVFTELAAACAEAGRWEFLFIVAPLVIEGGTGSPVNPIVVF